MKLFRRLFKKEDIVKELWEHLDDMRYGRMRKVNNEFYSGGSYYAYRTVVKHLDNFLHGKRISSKSINEPFIYEFIEYMESLMLSKNTIKNNIKNLYTLLNRLNRIGKIGKCNLPELRLPKDKTIKVYLSAEELVWLKNLKLSSHDRLSTVRDIFLVQCYTSLRFSDASKIMKNPKPFYYEENGHKYFKIITKKTRQPLIIPLKKEVIEILENTNF